MGQRHQLFVIARIQGRYRSLAAVHHQWLYGFTAIKQCHRLVRIFQADENRIPLRHELKSAQGCDKGIWDTEFSWQDAVVHFPFITTCLILGASFNPNEGYMHGVSIEPFNMAYDGGDNNNGITIIDITHLDQVRYCFVDFLGMECEREVPLNTSLSAETYLRAYYDGDKWSETLTIEIEGLQKFRLIPTCALQEAWEHGEWNLESDSEPLGEAATKSPNLSVRSLADTSMQTLINKALAAQSEEELEWLPDAESVPGFLSALKSRLYSGHVVAGTNILSSLLRRVLQGERHVDLSTFETLSLENVQTLLAELQKTTHIVALDLSNLSIDEATLQDILGLVPDVQRLYVMNTPRLTLESTLRALKGAQMRDIYHNEIFKSAFPADSTGTINRDTLQAWGAENNPVAQIIWVPASLSQADRHEQRLSNGSIDSNSPSSQSSRNDLERDFGVFPLYETFLPPIKIITGLTQLLHFATQSAFFTMRDSNKIGRAAALSFASGSSYVPEGPSLQVGSLLSVLAENSNQETRSRSQGLSTLPFEMRPGQWTVVVVHLSQYGEAEGSKQQLRYAFITPIKHLKQGDNENPAWSAENIVIGDISLFLEQAMQGKVELGLKEYWERQMDGLHAKLVAPGDGRSDITPKGVRDEFISVCSKAEVLSLLGRIANGKLTDE